MPIYSITEYCDDEGRTVFQCTPTLPPAGVPMGDKGIRFLGIGNFCPSGPDGKPIGHSKAMRFPIEGAQSLDEAFAGFDAAAQVHGERLGEATKAAIQAQRNRIVLPGEMNKPPMRIVK